MLTQTRLLSPVALWSSSDARVPVFGAFRGQHCHPVWSGAVWSILTSFYQNPNQPLAIWAPAAHLLDRTTRAKSCKRAVTTRHLSDMPKSLYDLGAVDKMFICCLVYSRYPDEGIVSYSLHLSAVLNILFFSIKPHPTPQYSLHKGAGLKTERLYFINILIQYLNFLKNIYIVRETTPCIYMTCARQIFRFYI